MSSNKSKTEFIIEFLFEDLTAQNLDKKDLFSESDPFYCLYRTNDDDSRTLVYRSEWIKVSIT